MPSVLSRWVTEGAPELQEVGGTWEGAQPMVGVCGIDRAEVPISPAHPLFTEDRVLRAGGTEGSEAAVRNVFSTTLQARSGGAYKRFLC